jgi:hypothetical protein
MDLIKDEGIVLTDYSKDNSAVLIGVCVACAAAIFAALFFLLIKTMRNKGKRKAKNLEAYIRTAEKPLGVTRAVSLLMPAAVRLRELHDKGRAHLGMSPGSFLNKKDGFILWMLRNRGAGAFSAVIRLRSCTEGKARKFVRYLFVCAVLLTPQPVESR